MLLQREVGAQATEMIYGRLIRYHYLIRRETSSEEGYYSCHIPDDLNSPA